MKRTYLTYTIANTSDVIATYIALTAGFREANPAVSWLIQQLALRDGLLAGWLLMQIVILLLCHFHRHNLIWFTIGTHVAMTCYWLNALIHYDALSTACAFSLC